MTRTKQIILYVLIFVVVCVCIGVVWHFFRNEIIVGLGWVSLFVIVYGVGWLSGRYGRIKK
ncbi:MAG: hypothetical protein J6R81_05450 [Alistipes sp.]|jgi:hypothetical protein|nr:hypothetical protein [Alistipes sp.]